MGKMHKNTENDLNLENSVLESAAAEADAEEQIIANMEDDEFEDVFQEERYTTKEKEMAKKIFQRKLKADEQQKGHLRKCLKTTEKELARYNNELVKHVKENIELKSKIKTRDTKIQILEKKLILTSVISVTSNQKTIIY